MNLQIYEGIDEIHSSEAFFKGYIYSNDFFLLPYVNLGVSEHPLNKSNELKFIDYSYIWARGIHYLSIDNEVITNNEMQGFESFYFGGFNLNEDETVNEFELKADSICLQLLAKSKVELKPWFPIDTPKYEKNLANVDDFFSNKMIPSNIEKYLKL